MNRAPHLRQLLTALFIVAAFGFLGFAVYRNLGELREFSWQVRPGLLVGSILAHIAVLLYGVEVWRRLLRRFDLRIGFRTLARLWFLSSLGRYIPGKIWQFVGVAHLATAAGMSSLTAVTSLAVQMGLSLHGAALTAVYLLPLGTEGVGAFLPALRWLAPLSLLLVHPRVISAGLALFQRVARRPVAPWTGRWRDGIGLLTLSVIGWLLYGGAFYLLLLALLPLPLAVLPAVTAMHALAFLVGYLVFVTPAGLGPKEGALTALLSTLLPLPVAAVVAVVARLWTVAAEVLPALFLLRGGAAGSGGTDPAPGSLPDVLAAE